MPRTFISQGWDDVGKAEWFALVATAIALITGGFAAWVQNESRISTVESAVEDLHRVDDTLIKEVLILTKQVAEMRGMHEEHVRTEKDAEQ